MFAKIVSGSLSKGLIAAICNGGPEDRKIGELTIINGVKGKFLALISDITLDNSTLSRRIVEDSLKSQTPDSFFENFHTKTLGVNISLIPLAYFNENSGELQRIDTIPRHLSNVGYAADNDIQLFYGKPDFKTLWPIGKPLKSNVEIPLDIDALTKTSFGIFGKSGVGKTFLGNLIAALITASDTGRNTKLLIFDMHSEYGDTVKDSKGASYENGVSWIFPEEFNIYTPCRMLHNELIKKTKTGKHPNIERFNISIDDIDVDDLVSCYKALGISEKFIQNMYVIVQKARKLISKEPRGRWLRNILLYYEDIDILDSEDVKKCEKFLKELKPPERITFDSAMNRLRRIIKFKEDFINVESTQISHIDSADRIVDDLLYHGKNVVVSFGRFGDDELVYTLICNIIAGRLRRAILNKLFKGERLNNKIIIFLEEAHRFLGPEVFYRTPFGDIARELRKRGVTLCVIDQRPSQLDENVTAMLWNKIILCLTESRDVEEASRGLPFESLFKELIPKLKRREALIFGEAVNIPVIVQILDYKEGIEKIAKVYYEGEKILEDKFRKILLNMD